MAFSSIRAMDKKEQPIKILIPIGSFYPSQQGGPSNSMYWLAMELRKYGWEFIVVTTDNLLPDNISKNKWINTEYGKTMFCTNRWRRLPLKTYFTAFGKMKRADIIHLNSLFYPLSFLMGISAVLFNKKIVWSVRGELATSALYYSGTKKKIYLSIFKKLFGRKVHFHTTSVAEQNDIRRVFGNQVKSRIIPNYMILPEKLALSKEKYISYIGRIHPIKGIENLINACFSSSEFMKSDFQLLIAGNHNHFYGRQIQELITNLNLGSKVQLIGHLEGIEKEKFLSKSYFNFLTSNSENFGLVVLEALAQGTPVVASKGTPWQSLETNQAGYWVENDVESLKDCINAILSMPHQKYVSICNNASELSKDFDIQRGSQYWHEFYKEIVYES